MNIVHNPIHSFNHSQLLNKIGLTMISDFNFKLIIGGVIKLHQGRLHGGRGMGGPTPFVFFYFPVGGWVGPDP